ncbi:MAG: TatD family hydrolase [Bacteroidales bacterium]|nr:TatD family hydrolase [Bacteroidales bacterium]
MKFIDTHAHLYDKAFSEDILQVIQRMEEAGVTHCILPGIDMSAYEAMISLSNSRPDLFSPCIGLHPTSVGEDWERELAFVKKHARDRRFAAIGEIGIDKYWSTDYLTQQTKVFAEQLELAATLDLPVIIHLRNSTEDIFKVFSDVRGIPLKGVFHAFSGSYETYKRILTQGDFKIGIGGVSTYKNAGVAATLEKVSLDDIVLETDAPWLTPVPFRGKRNESSYLIHIAANIAMIQGIPIETVATITTNNARKLFSL